MIQQQFFVLALRAMLDTSTICFFALRAILGTTTFFTLKVLNRTDSRGEARSAFTHFTITTHFFLNSVVRPNQNSKATEISGNL